ncbi:MAG: DUF962 domain-containing protein [Candidatus Obscuribacterales bacterium]|nr:DUF962 domain-containing protein [Candidatus Obscuribacterales bacterium]
MSITKRLSLNAKAFVVDYCLRHKHPLNAGLHLIGVPLVFFGLAKVFMGKAGLGAICFIGGYVFQYLGHKAQGNEVGEVTLIKNIWRKLSKREEEQ